MRRRTAVKIISFALAVAVIPTGFLIKEVQKTRRYKTEIQNSYSRNLDEFAAGINNISVILNKARFATSAKSLSEISARLLSEAEIAKTALSQLPSGEELTVLNRFLSQVGNYATSLSGALILGQVPDIKARENIELLSKTAVTIAEKVRDTRITYNNSEYWAGQLDAELDQTVDTSALSEQFNNLEGELADFPTLIYDGPYSDHILQRQAELLKEAEAVSEKEAQTKAEQWTDAETGSLSADGLIEGHIPCYRFAGEGVNVAVTRRGGYIYYIRKERQVTKGHLSHEQAIEKAKRYLSRMGMNGFIPTYYYENEGICVVNFAFLDGETICYTDLIKVGIATDSGEVMLYEAGGYISNHKQRAFLSTDRTREEAAAKLSPNLTLNGIALALIPTDSANEVRCYELSAVAGDGQEVLVYLNAVTLEEEDILILLKSDGGVLVK